VSFTAAPAANADQYDFVGCLDDNCVYRDDMLDASNRVRAFCRIVRTGKSSFSVDHAPVNRNTAHFAANLIRAVQARMAGVVVGRGSILVQVCNHGLQPSNARATRG
jgi:hypothetical protein